MKKITAFLLANFCLVLSFSQVNVTTFEGIDSIVIDDGIVVGPDDYVYGAHFNGGKVYKIDRYGIPTVFVSGLNAPNGLAFDSNSNLFIADHYGNKIYKATPSGVLTEYISAIAKPSGILKMQGSDTMIVTRYAANLILKMAPDGTIDTLSEGGLLNGPVGLDYDDDGNLFCANFIDRKLIHINPVGIQSELAQFPGIGWLGFMKYANGSFYGTAYNQHKIYKIRQSDTLISLFAGQSTIGEMDGDTSVATFNKPNGIAFNAGKDTMYISALGTGNIRRITNFNYDLSVRDQAMSFNELSVFPNPVNDNDLTVSLSLKEPADIQLLVMDLQGQIILSESQVGIAGDNMFSLLVNDLPSGTYFMVAEDYSNRIYKRFVKL